MESWKSHEFEVDFVRLCHCAVAEPEMVMVTETTTKKGF